MMSPKMLKKLMKPPKEKMGVDYTIKKNGDDEIVITCKDEKLRDRVYEKMDGGMDFCLRVSS